MKRITVTYVSWTLPKLAVPSQTISVSTNSPQGTAAQPGDIALTAVTLGSWLSYCPPKTSALAHRRDHQPV